MFLFSFLFIWFLFFLLLSFLCQLSNSFFFLVFDEIIVFSVFFYFYLVFLCWSLFILSSISVVIHWLLVFCIFIYSCNYILVFFFHFIESFFIISLSHIMISCCFSYTPLSLAYNIFVLFVVIILLLLFYVFCFLFFLFLILLKSLRNYFFMHLLNNINI